MDTTIRKGRYAFHGDNIFPHGISRSGCFNRRECEELAIYGATLEGLFTDSLSPTNEEEKQFVDEISSPGENSLAAVILWKKYLAAVEQRSQFHGFSMSNGRQNTTQVNSFSLD